MKKLLLIGLLLTLPACTKAPPNLTPQVQAQFYATQGIKDLDVIRDFAVGASQTTPPLITKATLLQVVNWHEDLVKAIHVAPNGWKTTASAGLDALSSRLSSADAARFKPYIDAARLLFQELP